MPYSRRRKNAVKKSKPKSGSYMSKARSAVNAGFSVASLASKAWAGVKMLKGLINVEKKFFDTSNSASISNSGIIYPLSQIAVGDTYNTREGNSIKAVSDLIRLSANLNTSAEATYLRLLIFLDTENQGSNPGVTDVLESANYLSPLNHVNGARFTVLKDRMLVLDKTINARMFHEFMKCAFHVRWSGSNGTDTKENHMYLLLITDQATNTPVVSWNNRLRFIDN